MTRTPFSNSARISWFAIVVIKVSKGHISPGSGSRKVVVHTSSGIPPVTVQLSTNLDTPSGNYCPASVAQGRESAGLGKVEQRVHRVDADTEGSRR